ncbi:MAG: Fe-S-containing hydro-lyase [candidate division KSB1 bacterium]|nr:Fe-S-containing hydro-lyase [candidate division KSB1 bacterium]MDZ7392795.1 Fe-S-containing hydro-lyase [candidate division KSB1 bacterium]MDZ7412699.1 Fe-S-containing hydro-lyase [candidate division KSB1 bacterium]
MAEAIKITTPLTDEQVEKLRVGDSVLITGVIYTGRDAAHKRLVELLAEGKPLPFDVKGQLIYYVGPSPARPGMPIGSAGPTTSYRMDPYAPALIRQGLKGMIGKGEMGAEVAQALQAHKAVYFAAVGGAAALIAKSILKSEVVAYEDLGAEAIQRLEVKNFPAIVAQDCHGGNIYREGRAKYEVK